MNNKQKIRDFIEKHGLTQTECAKRLGIKKGTFWKYLDEGKDSPDAPPWVYVSIRMYDRIQELELRLSKIDNLDELTAKYDKIKAIVSEVQG